MMNPIVKAKLVRKALKLHVKSFNGITEQGVAAKRVEFTALSGEKLRDYIAFRVSMNQMKETHK